MNISTFNLVKCYCDITMGIATGTQTVFGEERIISSAIMKVKPRLFFFFLPNSLIHVSFFVPLHCLCCKCWSLPWVIQTNCSQFRLDKRHRAMKCKKIWVCMKLPLNEIWQGDILYLLRVDSQGRRSWNNLLTELYNVFVFVKGLFGLKLLGWVSHYRPL